MQNTEGYHLRIFWDCKIYFPTKIVVPSPLFIITIFRSQARKGFAIPRYQHIKKSPVIPRLFVFRITASFAGFFCAKNYPLKSIVRKPRQNYFGRFFLLTKKHSGTQSQYRYATFSFMAQKKLRDCRRKVEGLLDISFIKRILNHRKFFKTQPSKHFVINSPQLCTT